MNRTNKILQTAEKLNALQGETTITNRCDETVGDVIQTVTWEQILFWVWSSAKSLNLY